MAETGQLENSSESGSNSQNQSQAQQASQQQPTHSLPEPVENCEESSMPQQLEETGSGDEGSHDQLVTPPATPPSQPEDACTGSSEPSSPPPEDSLSSGGEQGSLPEDGPPFMTPGGMMPLNPGLMLDPQFLPPQMLMHPLVVQSKGLPSDGGQPGGDPSLPLPQGEDLKRLLLQQVEYYFSKENLGSDKYLLSQMDGDHFVPISIIAGFSKVKQLTADVDLITEAIRDSSLLQLDEEDEKVRAVPEKRCVLILREIPKETPKKDITGLFSHESCPHCVTCEFAENDCWYVTFDSEEDTQKAFSYLREEVREFLGHPIRARIKGTVVQHSAAPKKSRFTFPMQTVYNGTGPMPYYQQPGMVQAWPTYYDPNYAPYMNGYPPHQGGFNGPPNRYNNMHNSHHHGAPGGRGSGPGGRGRPPRSHSPGPSSSIDGVGGSNGSGRSSRGDYPSSGGRYRRDRDDDRQSRNIPRLRNKQRGGAGDGERNPPPRQQHRQQQKLDLAPANFPPLPTSEIGVTSPNPAPPPTANHAEEGVSNLADIVKGKRLKDGSVGYLSNGFGGGHQLEKSGSVASSATSGSQPPVQQSNQCAAQTPPQPQPQPQTQPPKPELKSPSKDSKPLQAGSSRSTERDSAPYKQNASRTTQVAKVEGRPALPLKSRHRERERRTGSGSRPPQPPRPSPKTPRKQLPPPPPSAANGDRSPVKQESGLKSEKLSYAQMAQRPKSQSTPVKTPAAQPSNSSSNNSSSSPSKPPAPGQATPQAPPQSPVKPDLTNGVDGEVSPATPSSPPPSSQQPTSPTPISSPQ